MRTSSEARMGDTKTYLLFFKFFFTDINIFLHQITKIFVCFALFYIENILYKIYFTRI